MYNNILTVNQGENLAQGRLMNFSPNDLLFYVDDGSTADITSIDDLDNVIVNVRKKGSGQTELILDGVRLSDIFKISNAFGGYAFDKSNTKHFARLPIGKISLTDKEVLEVEIQNALTGKTDITYKVAALETEEFTESIRKYEGLNAGGDNQNFNNCLAIFAMDEYSGNTTINDGVSSEQMTYIDSNVIVNSMFNIEIPITSFGLVYADKYHEGRSVTAKLPTGNYVIVGRL